MHLSASDIKAPSLERAQRVSTPPPGRRRMWPLVDVSVSSTFPSPCQTRLWGVYIAAGGTVPVLGGELEQVPLGPAKPLGQRP